jgi:hypothetical protein
MPNFRSTVHAKAYSYSYTILGFTPSFHCYIMKYLEMAILNHWEWSGEKISLISSLCHVFSVHVTQKELKIGYCNTSQYHSVHPIVP